MFFTNELHKLKTFEQNIKVCSSFVYELSINDVCKKEIECFKKEVENTNSFKIYCKCNGIYGYQSQTNVL